MNYNKPNITASYNKPARRSVVMDVSDKMRASADSASKYLGLDRGINTINREMIQKMHLLKKITIPMAVKATIALLMRNFTQLETFDVVVPVREMRKAPRRTA